jgi:hypothetical protein
MADSHFQGKRSRKHSRFLPHFFSTPSDVSEARDQEKKQSCKVNKILRPVRQNCYERKGQRAAERAINALLTSMSRTRPLIPQVHPMTGIPETNLRRWQHMTAKDPEWRIFSL